MATAAGKQQGRTEEGHRSAWYVVLPGLAADLMNILKTPSWAM
jgi:hypothetical protein